MADFHPFAFRVQEPEGNGVLPFGCVFSVLRNDLAGTRLDELILEMLSVPSRSERRLDALQDGTFGTNLVEPLQALALLLWLKPSLDRANVTKSAVLLFRLGEDAEQVAEALPVHARAEVELVRFP